MGITINWDASSTSSFMRESKITFRAPEKIAIKPRNFSQKDSREMQ